MEDDAAAAKAIAELNGAENYDFMRKAVPWLDFLKIRFSYGQVGNDRISNKRFPYLTIIN